MFRWTTACAECLNARSGQIEDDASHDERMNVAAYRSTTRAPLNRVLSVPHGGAEAGKGGTSGGKAARRPRWPAEPERKRWEREEAIEEQCRSGCLLTLFSRDVTIDRFRGFGCRWPVLADCELCVQRSSERGKTSG
jgi:hypothetical protein